MLQRAPWQASSFLVRLLLVETLAPLDLEHLSTWSNVWHNFGNLRKPEVKGMIYVSLTQTQRDELMHCSHQAIGRVASAAQMVLLSDRGFTVPQIAAIHACGQDVVRTWLHRSEREGRAGLEDEPRSGRPPQDPLAGPIVDAQARASPPCSGHVQTCWTVCRLSADLSARFQLCLSCSTIRRLLHQTGWRWARPRLAPARKHDPQAEAKRAALAAAKPEAVQGRVQLLSLDES